jgi:hypothetical protein
MFVLFAVMALLSMAQVNPKARDIADRRMPGPPTPLEVAIGWSKNTPVDIDMWTFCQTFVDNGWHENHLVMFKRRSDGWIDLQRDDVGDADTMHFEVLRTNSEVKAVPPLTRCWVNAHLYSLHGKSAPVKVFASATLNRNASDGSEHMFPAPGKDLPKDETGQQWALSSTITEQAGEVNLFLLFWDAHGKLQEDVSEAYPNINTCALARNELPQGVRRCGS